MTEEMRRCSWRAAPADQLVWASWEGDHVLFHRLSGKTHVVNAVAAFLLQQVLLEARDAESVVSALAGAQGRSVDDKFRASVLETLTQLESLRLVERLAA